MVLDIETDHSDQTNRLQRLELDVIVFDWSPQQLLIRHKSKFESIVQTIEHSIMTMMDTFSS